MGWSTVAPPATLATFTSLSPATGAPVLCSTISLTTVTVPELVFCHCVVVTPFAQLARSAPSPGTLSSVVAPAPSGSVSAVESIRPLPSTTSPSLILLATIEESP